MLYLVKVVAFSGLAPVDEVFRETVNEGYHVYKEGEVIWDCMLNQVEIVFLQEFNYYYN